MKDQNQIKKPLQSEYLQTVWDQAKDKIISSANERDLDSLMHAYFGRKKGLISTYLKNVGSLNSDSKREIGKLLNVIKSDLLKLISDKRKTFANAQTQRYDLTLPGRHLNLGHRHPLGIVIEDTLKIFQEMGFGIAFGPEIETDYYNFEALNMPPEHPARDMWDTFFIKDLKGSKPTKYLLRTHTSPMQIRLMEKHKPPMAVVVPGKVFRHEATDSRHEHTFDQLEGFLVDEQVNVGHLKYFLLNFFHKLFGKQIRLAFRPSYFPFTEPSYEVIISCPFCTGGCKVCGSGWLEMLGCGMINQKVFTHVGYPKDKYTGFAFGIGLARIAMIKYQIPDIRYFYQNDLRTINQFY